MLERKCQISQRLIKHKIQRHIGHKMESLKIYFDTFLKLKTKLTRGVHLQTENRHDRSNRRQSVDVGSYIGEVGWSTKQFYT